MARYRTYKEIANELGVSIDTIRRNVLSNKEELKIDPKKQKTPSSKGALVACLSSEDAEKLIRFYKTKGTTKSKLNSNRNYGFFYLIQLIPEFQPNRVKIGFADDVDKRFKEHQTSSPTAKLLGYWPCKRVWDQAAMDSLTRTGCKLVLNEVYEGDIQGFIDRAEEFFGMMPDPTTEIK
ncbi:MAG: hypothetical protein HOE30_05040, partial [Deltaproteobacteria bacterium]|nr:hypothetical protein [Deltaproteobacteria bacterium]